MDRRMNPYSRGGRLVVALLAGLALFGAGCATMKQRVNEAWDAQSQRVSEAIEAHEAAKAPVTSDLALRQRLAESHTGFASLLVSAADRIKESCPDLETKRRAVQWKARAVPLYGSLVSAPNSRVALMDVLTFTSGMAYSLESGEASELFGGCQAVAVEAAQKARDRAWAIAASLLSPEALATVEQDVDAWVRTHSYFDVGGARVQDVPAALADPSRPMAKSILNIPLSAFDLLSGIDDATQAVREMTRVGDKIAGIAEYSPQYGQWSLELLLYDLLDAPEVRAALDSARSLSESASALLSMGQELPREMRADLARLGQEADRHRQAMEKLLATTRQALSEGDRTLDKARGAAEDLTTAARELAVVARDMGELTGNLDRTAGIWGRTIGDAGDLADRLAHRPVPGETEPPPDLLMVAQRLEQAADKFLLLTDRAQGLLDAVAPDQALAGLSGLLNRVFLFLCLLILVFFSSLFAYRMLGKRFLRGKS
ncbi:MAG: hypothetical protein KKA60_08160 [Proteobacteria bacterium]|nr:hypothetical protein [Pseudomonadota bacterium]